MAILGTLLKKGITLRESLEQLYSSPFDLQKRELQNLLIHCQQTRFGEYYGFKRILQFFKRDKDAFYWSFKDEVPVFDYDTIYDQWWSRSKDGEEDACYPGKVKYFALSSFLS